LKRALAAWLLAPLVLLALFSSRLAAIAQGPAIEMAREGLAISRLPPILGDEEVRKQLGTGLTTSFAFQATAKGAAGKVRGGARVDVRYDLWDEVYIVSRIDATGRAARVTLPSFERLAEWWREARLVVIRAPAAAGVLAADLELRVIPFSQAEQLDAQRWFSQALSAERSGGAGAVSDAVEDQPESFSQVINLLMATSIGRPALLEYRWKLPVPVPAGSAGKKR
jgi:hypothetical protein